ncbi:ESPR-type extended signal peptide-containing protein, partial [Haemophilus sp. CCUG 66565]|uniref:ESPR-type extended signal peptide-containing protein n=1 Tax=Haemophilus sp. CCUG 66565 TaxID=1859694 RepID=UPI000B2DA0F7
MNNIFKIIWNKTTQRLEVVSELAKGAVKASSTSTSHQSKSITIKSTLKLSLLSLCLGFTNEAMALANIDGNTTFHAGKGEVLRQNGNGKYAVGVYDKASASFAFGYAQAGRKDEEGNEPASVGGKQLAIGNDNLTASGWNSIAIGSNSNRKGGSQGMGTIAIGAGMQAIGRNVVSIGTDSGSGGKYNGYDDAVYLGSYSRINPKGQGQADNINTSALENTYTTAVTNYNRQNNETNLNAIINAGRAINNVALNKVDAMTIKSNSNTNNKFNVTESTITPLNESKDKTTVSILSIGGKNGDNKMYRQIQNVAAGRMSADSFDAVNGSQLYYVRNYTGWNIGHNSDNKDTVTGRVNNDHTVIFKANGNYVNVSTTLDSTNKSTVNIGVNTSDISVTKNNERITAVAANNPTNTVATNTVATATSVKTALETFNEVKADKVDIMGYSHVNSNGNTRDEALLKADGTKATFNYEGRNNSSITNASDGQTKDNNGKYAEASGAQADRSIASGVYANAFAKDSIAIGTGANVNNYWGSQFSESINGIAIGKLAQVEGSAGAIAFGAGSTILRNLSYNVGSANAIAIGNNSKITAASGAIAIGNDTNITAIDTGVGNGAVNAIAIGNGATVERRNSIALGQGTKASAESSIALGNATKVSGTNTVAIGTSVTATKENTVAIGTNVTAAKENSVVIGQNASATMERVVAIGAYAKADGDRTVAIGPEATAGASRSIVIGGLGDDAKDNQAKSESGATQAIVIGNGAQAKAAASYSITLGNSAKTEAVTGISIGDRANVASGANSGIALGKSAVANKSGDIAIGESSSTSAKHTVSGLKIGDATLSTGVAATDNGTVSFGNNTIKRQIQNVGAGEISDTSSDVITGSQLYHVIKAADEIAKTEYKFKVNGNDIKTMSNKGTSAVNNVNNTLDFKAGDGLDVAYENNAVTYKLNADSKNSIIEAKNAAKTVTTKLNEINQSVARAEAAAGNAANSATEADKAKVAAEAARDIANTKAGEAATSATAAAGSAKTASDKAAEAAGSAQTATDK